jgi:hypothetical protein
MKKISMLVLCLYCAACSNTQEKKSEDKNNIDHAITSPLKDLNLLREKIPVALLAADKNPYLLPDMATSCEQLDQEIKSLDQVLAPDVDAPKQQKIKDDNHIERGAELVGEASINAIKRTTESLVPYRSWVRKLTGAERESKLVARAIKSGNLRRAFLKGFKVSSCKQ